VLGVYNTNNNNNNNNNDNFPAENEKNEDEWVDLECLIKPFRGLFTDTDINE